MDSKTVTTNHKSFGIRDNAFNMPVMSAGVVQEGDEFDFGADKNNFTLIGTNNASSIIQPSMRSENLNIGINFIDKAHE